MTNMYDYILENSKKFLTDTPCLKQSVIAMIVTQDNQIVFGSNGINNQEITECPRVLENMKTGEGYHLCVDVCNQNGHAEGEAIASAKNQDIDIENSTLYLIGHTYCCDKCLSDMKDFGITKVYVINEKNVIIMTYTF